MSKLNTGDSLLNNKPNHIPTKWTLFLKEHWKAKDLVKELAPAYYFKDLENYNWKIHLENIKRPGHFLNLCQCCDSYQAKIDLQKPSEERIANLFLIREFFLFQESLLRLLPKNMKELIQKEFRPDFIQSFLFSHVEKELHATSYPEELKSRNLLCISLLQMAAANHSLSFLLMYRWIHNELLLNLMLETKNAKFSQKYKMDISNAQFENLFNLPAYFCLSYDDLLQSIRLIDLLFQLVSRKVQRTKIIANRISP
jgi:hypothetical protein